MYIGLDSLLVLTEVPSDKVTSYKYVCYIHTFLCYTVELCIQEFFVNICLSLGMITKHMPNVFAMTCVQDGTIARNLWSSWTVVSVVLV